MNVAFGLLPALGGPRRSKSARKLAHAERSLAALDAYLQESQGLRA
jgi:hypothetical protein